MIKMGIMPNAVTNEVLASGYQENRYLKSAFQCSEDLKRNQALDVLSQENL